MGKGHYKCRILDMNLKLREQQLKTIYYIYNMYIYWTAISKPHGNCKLKICIRYTHTHKKNQSQENKSRREEKRPKETKTINKMSIMTCIDELKVNGLNVPTKRHRMPNGYKKNTPKILLSPRDPHQIN